MNKTLVKPSSLLQRFQYEIAVLLCLLMRGLPMANFSSVSGWQTMSYVLSYKYGFSSRFLIGSLFRLLHPDFVSAKDTALLVNATVILDCIITAIVLGALLRAAQKRGQVMLAAIPAIIYLALPVNISIYFCEGYAGKLEIFLFPFMILSSLILMRTKPGWKQTVAVSLVSIVALLIYQNYVFLCFPLILAILIYNLYSYGWTKKNLLCALTICVVTGVFFLYLQLFAKINAQDAAALTAELQNKTDMRIFGDAVFYEYFASFSEFFVDLMLYRYGYQITIMILDLLLLSPVIFIFIYIWVHAFRSCTEKKEKHLLAMMQLSSLAFLPTYIITCDWARWTIWLIIFHTAIPLILLYKNFDPMVAALSKTLELIKKYWVFAVFVIFYLLSLSVLSVTEMFIISRSIYHKLP